MALFGRVASMILVAQLLCAQRLGLGVGGYATQDEQAIYHAIREGRYKDGLKTVKAAVIRARALGLERGTVSLYASIALFWLEVGNLPQSTLALDSAKQLYDMSPFPLVWETNGQRVRAALRLEQGEYESAFRDAADRYHQGADNPLNLAGAYRFGLAALAQLRLGDIPKASELSAKSLRFIPNKDKESLFYAPRILYAACLVESHQGKFTEAEEHCLRGLSFVEPYGIQNRDVSLGYLALAESLLLKGDLAGARQAVKKSIDLTGKMFGTPHQDLIEGRKLLALISMKEGNINDAQAFAADACKMATQVFGESSTGLRVLKESLKSTQASVDRVGCP